VIAALRSAAAALMAALAVPSEAGVKSVPAANWTSIVNARAGNTTLAAC